MTSSSPGMAYAAILRSPYAHAKILSIDTIRAKSMPGVVGVFTGDDFMDVNPLPAAWQAAKVQNNVNTPRVLQVGEVHQVGDGIAVVVAEKLEQAVDALEASRSVRGTAGGRRCQEGDRARRAPAPRERAEQCRPRMVLW